jgi:hypothetical protein
MPVLRIRRQFFGPDHPDTLMAKIELGMCSYARRAYLAAADKVIQGVIKAWAPILGEEHAYTLMYGKPPRCDHGSLSTFIAYSHILITESAIPLSDRRLT